MFLVSYGSVANVTFVHMGQCKGTNLDRKKKIISDSIAEVVYEC